jgi:hypothetical protein
MHHLGIDTLVTPALIKRFHDEGKFEGAAGAFYAFVQKSNGDLLAHSVGPDVGAAEHLFAADLLSYLNRHLHHDGAWCMVFTHPKPPQPPLMQTEFDRLVVLWMDKDGDVQFPLEHNLGIVTALEWAMPAWAQQCETAWALWRQAVAALELQPGETFKRAKGERRPTLH